jgi:Tol biopolymer transport system component/DNA-binding winged helix-turn-helix (wHTH) protein
LTLSPPSALIRRDLPPQSTGDFPGSRAYHFQRWGSAMGNSVQTEKVIRFQDFKVNLDTGELWKAGVRLKLQDQPFKVLATLLERPGQVVTREELRQLIWPQESFGDFDHAINLAIAKLRATLGDSADVPHLIETLPRRGYRFIAPVEGRTATPRDVPLSAKVRVRLTRKWIGIAVGAAALILVSTVAILRLQRRFAEQSSSVIEVVPLVSMPGRQGLPAVSPDGRQVAFRYAGDHTGIYTALVGGEKPLQLTENESDYNPTWSPDGRQIAFERYSVSENQKSFYVIPALGGSEHRLYTVSYPKWAHCNKMDWSPDGESLVFTESVDSGARSRLALLSLSDLTARPLTSPHNQEFDCEPTFSPDGTTVAFVHGTMGAFRGDLFVMKVPDGEPVRLTSGNSGGSPAWTQDGSDIVFASSFKGIPTLWRISARGGTPRRVAGAGGEADAPSTSRGGDLLAYWVWKQWDTIWRLDLKDERHPLGPPVRLLSGRGVIWKPSYSPDGKKIAFESNREGYLDIWVCDNDGSNCSQLTSRQGQSGTPRWSPDGRYIAFESITQGFYEVYIVEVAGGTPRFVPTFPEGNNGAPNWSRDGKWIYFYSAHERGPYQLWKVPLQGPPVRVTKNGGVYASESHDGRFIYYAKFNEPGLWRMPLNGGEETHVLDQPKNWTSWHLLGPESTI